MKNNRIFLLAVSVLFVFALAPAPAQDLTKLANKTRDERLKVKMQKSVRVWTNDNMPKRPAGEGPAAAAGIAATPPPPGTGGGPPTPSPEAAGASADESDTSAIDSLRDQIKQTQQRVAASEERQRLAEDELGLLQVQQATELSPDTQNDLAAKFRAKTAAIDSRRQEIEKAKKEIEKLEKEFVAAGGTLEEKK